MLSTGTLRGCALIALASIALGCTAAVAAVAAAPAPAAPQTGDQWVEEVLLQLSELRKAQGEMRDQLSELAGEVAELRGGDPRPKTVRFDLGSGTYPVLGPNDAAIAVVEFSDFECPFCRRHYENTMPTLQRKYIDTGRIRYVFVDFPLAMHANAESAAVAGACAEQQGAFWQMRSALFSSQRALGADTYGQLAARLSLDAERFAACQRDPKMLAGVRERVRLGESAGVQGTPAFLIGRVRDGVLEDASLVSGAQPAAVFEQILDALIGDPVAAN